MLNLVANAIKFTERGGSVTVSAAVEGSRLMLRVTDTGVGIAADDLKRIGDPFFQAGKTYQRKHEGTGLGLSIVKGLVGLHHGEIERAEQGRRRHHRDGSLAAHFRAAAGTGADKQYRDAEAGAAIRSTRPSPSGEEKCLDVLPRMTRCRAAAAARRRLQSRPSDERGLAMRMLLHSPKDMVAGLLAAAAICAILTNALFLQAGRHPSPMFGSVVTLPVPAPAVASPLPRPRPVELATKPVEPEPVEAKPVEIKTPSQDRPRERAISEGADPMTNLVVKSTVAPVARALECRTSAGADPGSFP